MTIRYRYVRQLGQNEHNVELYSDWTKDEGLVGKPIETFCSTRFADVKKEAKPFLTADQMGCMSVKFTGKYSHLVIGEDGKVLEANL